jgi:hypothetical protein
MPFECRTCGETHDGPPPAVGFPVPDPLLAVPEEDRARRALLSSDQCVIDDEHYFVLGCLEIPVQGGTDPFVWMVWTSLSRASFRRASDLWTTEGRESEPPYFGWLSSRIPGYPDTTNLKCLVHTRPVGERPFVELEPTDHPLAVDQRRGIPRDRLNALVERALHG